MGPSMTPLSFLGQIGNLKELSNRSLALLLIYYLRKYDNKLLLSLPDIKETFRTSALKPPARLSQLLREMATGRDARLIPGTGNCYSLSIHGLQEVEGFLTSEKRPETTLAKFIESADRKSVV